MVEQVGNGFVNRVRGDDVIIVCGLTEPGGGGDEGEGTCQPLAHARSEARDSVVRVKGVPFPRPRAQ